MMQKGFTLIELLIVIAIIGMLASIITFNLIEPSKIQSKDANIAMMGAEVRTLSERINTKYLSYVNLCNGTNDGFVNEFRLDVVELEIQNNGGVITCYDSINKWCFSIELNSGKFYCADSYGEANNEQLLIGCDGINFDCN